MNCSKQLFLGFNIKLCSVGNYYVFPSRLWIDEELVEIMRMMIITTNFNNNVSDNNNNDNSNDKNYIKSNKFKKNYNDYKIIILTTENK